MSSDPEQITFFAKTDARGQEIPFGIKAADRTRHVYVIGKTGMGKSTLLENMAIQDIKNGNGLAFIDPHGQTAETLLDYIPEERKDDVLYFAPFDTNNPVAFNVMEDVGADRRHLVVSGLMSVFKKIWVDAWSARMEYILSNTLLALLEYPDSTLLGVNRMLSDKVYRKKVIDNISDPSVKSFWVDEFLKYNERYMQEAGDAIKNKIGQFTSNPLIRNIVGQPHSSFDIREMMDNKKILIMNLSKGLVGESNANLLGSMLTTRIYLAAMSRADMTQEEMKAAPNFYFYVDEFQSFANATFANILSEARKYKLNLTIAHQYIEQMEEEVRDAVFGNVGTLITFRVGPFDAEVLETVFTPKFLAPDIVNLGFAQIYLTLMIDGIGSQPFSATTLPPIKPTSISSKEIIIDRSRKQFSHPRAEVEKAIFQWHGIEDSPKPPQPPKVTEPIENKKTDIPAPEQSPQPREQKQEVKTPVPYTKKPLTVTTESSDSLAEQRPKRPDTKSKERVQKQPANESRTRREKPDRVKDTQKISTNDSVKSSTPNVPQNSKTLDELRAVLKSLSRPPVQKDEKKDLATQNNTPTPSASASSDGENQSRPSLKEALATVVGQTVENKQATFAEQNTTSTTFTPNSVLQKQNAGQQPPENTSTVKPQDNQNSDDPFSPKKLERMMRITGNDKSPLG
jgi:hypothetical protein